MLTDRFIHTGTELDDEGEVTFMHPNSGDMYGNIYQCLVGWEEQNEKDNIARETLADMICCRRLGI